MCIKDKLAMMDKLGCSRRGFCRPRPGRRDWTRSVFLLMVVGGILALAGCVWPTPTGSGLEGTLGTGTEEGFEVRGSVDEGPVDQRTLWAYEIIYRINRLREGEGLPPYKATEALMRSAQAHAEDCARRGDGSHTGSDGSDVHERMLRDGYEPDRWGENIVLTTSPAEAIQWWYDEVVGGHRANLLHPVYREIGVGVARDTATGLWWFVADLGMRSGVYPVVIDKEAWGTRDPVVSLAIYGAGWGAEAMRVGEDATFAGREWEPFASQRLWTFSGAYGVRRVCVQLRREGEVLGPFEDWIMWGEDVPLFELGEP